MERYEEHDGCYVLYVGKVKVAASERVAVLLDAERSSLITHGDPQEVRRELDALRAVEPQRTAAWLLLEGRPALGALNRALHGDVDIHDLHLAFTQASARRVVGDLMARLRQRGKT
jgi:hypothetical protein